MPLLPKVEVCKINTFYNKKLGLNFLPSHTEKYREIKQQYEHKNDREETLTREIHTQTKIAFWKPTKADMKIGPRALCTIFMEAKPEKERKYKV